MKTIRWLLSLIAMFLVACNSSPARYEVHYGAATIKPPVVNKVLILPADITVKERFPGDVKEEVPLWINQADLAVVNELAILLNTNLGVSVATRPELQHESAIKQHIPLIKTVARAVRVHSSGWNLWPHKMQQFDYTIGKGLKSLKNSGIDAVMFIGGSQVVQTFRYDDTKTSVYTYRKKDLSLDDLAMALILIDVSSGDLIWTYFGKFENLDLRENEEIQAMLTQALEKFPRHILRI